MGKLIFQLVPVLFCSYVGQVLMRSGMKAIGPFTWSLILAEPLHFLRAVVISRDIILGFMMAGIGAVFYLVVLSQTELTVALPVMAALGFLVLPLIGILVLHEQVTGMRVLGTIIIVVGMIVVARSG